MRKTVSQVLEKYETGVLDGATFWGLGITCVEQARQAAIAIIAHRLLGSKKDAYLTTVYKLDKVGRCLLPRAHSILGTIQAVD